MRKNALRIVLVTVVVVLCHCNYLNAQGWSYPTEQIQDLPYEDGMGTEEAPYRITNAQQLANLSYYVNNGVGYEGIYFALAADIDLNPGYTFGKDGTISGGDAPQQWCRSVHILVTMIKTSKALWMGKGILSVEYISRFNRIVRGCLE